VTTTLKPHVRQRLDRLRLRHLRLLQLVSQHGSLGAAAEQLGVSQPATSLLLQELEKVFGAVLVTRGVRGAALTVAGQRTLDRLSIALASVDNAMLAARTPSVEPLLRVGCAQVAAFDVVARTVSRMQAAGVGGRFAVNEGETLALLEDLTRGRLDCVIGWLDEKAIDLATTHDLTVENMISGRMCVIASAGNALTARSAVRVSELVSRPWVITRPGSRTYASFRQLFVSNNCEVPIHKVECASIHSGIHIVSQSDMLGMAPDRLVEEYTALGLVRQLRGPQLALTSGRLSLFAPPGADSIGPFKAFAAELRLASHRKATASRAIKPRR